MIIVVMGVSGSGKSTIGDALSKKLNCAFAEADQYHPDSNKQKMRNGMPLSDEDRWPWLLQLHDIIYSLYEAGALGVVTCSALKKIYRQVLVKGPTVLGQSPGNSHNSHNVTDDSLGADGESSYASANDNTEACAKSVVFVYLRTSESVLQSRLEEREDSHYMPASLLMSQLETLEEPTNGEQHITVTATDKSVEDILSEVEEKLRNMYGLGPDQYQ